MSRQSYQPLAFEEVVCVEEEEFQELQRKIGDTALVKHFLVDLQDSEDSEVLPPSSQLKVC